MLTYTTNSIEKSIRNIKETVAKEEAFAEVGIAECLKRYEGTDDDLKKYQGLVYSYSSCAKCYLLADHDTEKWKGYYYLAAKAADILYQLYDNGCRTNEAFIKQLENRNHLRYTQYAILANHKPLAVQLAGENSLLGQILCGDYEKAKSFLPDEIKETKYTSYIDEILWAIVYQDEKKMNRYFEKRIKMLRRQARTATPTALDSYGLALIKLAQERIMNFRLNVRELPFQLLNDTPVNENEWHLPEDHGLKERNQSC